MCNKDKVEVNLIIISDAVGDTAFNMVQAGLFNILMQLLIIVAILL